MFLEFVDVQCPATFLFDFRQVRVLSTVYIPCGYLQCALKESGLGFFSTPFSLSEIIGVVAK